MLTFPVGLPGWRTAARLGFTLSVNVSVLWDDDAGVFVARSDDLLPDFGCVAEASSWDGLRSELNAVLSDAFESVLGRKAGAPAFETVLRFA